MKKNIFVIVGESGTGKTTISKIISSNANLELLVTSTSRPKRVGESELDYNFLSKEDFEELLRAKKFVEYAVFKDWYYGLNKETVEKAKSDNMIVVLNPVGLENLIRILDKDLYNIIPIYIYSDEKIRLIRSLERDSDIDEIFRRILADRNDFKEIPLYVLKNNGYIIRNDKNLNLTVNQLEYIVNLVIGDLNG